MNWFAAVDLPVADVDVLHLGDRAGDAVVHGRDRDEAVGGVEGAAVELPGRDDREDVGAVVAEDRRQHGRRLVEEETPSPGAPAAARAQRVAADRELVDARAELDRERLDVLELDAAVAGLRSAASVVALKPAYSVIPRPPTAPTSVPSGAVWRASTQDSSVPRRSCESAWSSTISVSRPPPPTTTTGPTPYGVWRPGPREADDVGEPSPDRRR